MRTKHTLTDDEIRAKLDALTDFDGPVPAHRPELGPCWVWLGKVMSNGYGWLSANGEVMYVHRLALYLETGSWPERSALHKCDNKICRRPFHLFTGTQLENIQDMTTKGRRAFQGGTLHGMAKLTEAVVLALRRAHAAGTPIMELARHNTMASKTQIQSSVHGRSWKHVPEPVLECQCKHGRPSAKLSA